jgi:hypothetical protein
MVSSRLKGIIFNKLYSELSHLEIIEYKDEIWFIDREDRRWYFIYNTNGTMWWKYGFFCNFFEFFSITERDKFGPILSSWVEEVLNCRVTTTHEMRVEISRLVEEVLNCRVTTTQPLRTLRFRAVEDVLNCKVTKTKHTHGLRSSMVEDVLKYKVEKSFEWLGHPPVSVNGVLNSTEK